jgi:hypothetical protein
MIGAGAWCDGCCVHDVWTVAFRKGGVMRIVVFTFVALVSVFAVAPAIDAQSGDLANVAACNEEALRRAGNPSASPGAREKPRTLSPEPGTRTDASGSIVTKAEDPLLEGMATDGLTDPAYRSAYRECMAARAKRQR